MKRRQKAQGVAQAKKTDKGRKKEPPKTVSAKEKNGAERSRTLHSDEVGDIEINTRSQQKTKVGKGVKTAVFLENEDDDQEKVFLKSQGKQKSKGEKKTDMATNVKSEGLNLTQYRDKESYNSDVSSSETDSNEDEDSDASMTVKCTRSPDDSGSSVQIVEPEENSEEEKSSVAGKNRKRAFKFTEEENLQMCRLLCPCFKYIYTRVKNAEEFRRKEKVWEDMANEISTVSQIQRTAYNCRRRFQDCKAKVQEKIAQEKFTTVHYNKWESKLRDAILRNHNLGRRKGTKRKNKRSTTRLLSTKNESTDNESELEKESIESVVKRNSFSENSDENDETSEKKGQLKTKQKVKKHIFNVTETNTENDITSETEKDNSNYQAVQCVTENGRNRSKEANQPSEDEYRIEESSKSGGKVSHENVNKTSRKMLTVTVDMHKLSNTTTVEVKKPLACDIPTENTSTRPKRSATKSYSKCSDYIYDASVYSLERKNKKIKDKGVSGVVHYDVSSNDEERLSNDTVGNSATEIQVHTRSSVKRMHGF
ncbi:transcriptional regulator ATRX homolog [Hyperolius riggenbachi]|uniref:transcriptional regulator ATRX homolog n=1 Tax=Hyperolius riggenbachi TaxID=752182 RepID=UPI0035A3998D